MAFFLSAAAFFSFFSAAIDFFFLLSFALRSARSLRAFSRAAFSAAFFFFSATWSLVFFSAFFLNATLEIISLLRLALALARLVLRRALVWSSFILSSRSLRMALRVACSFLRAFSWTLERRSRSRLLFFAVLLSASFAFFFSLPACSRARLAFCTFLMPRSFLIAVFFSASFARRCATRITFALLSALALAALALRRRSPAFFFFSWTLFLAILAFLAFSCCLALASLNILTTRAAFLAFSFSFSCWIFFRAAALRFFAKISFMSFFFFSRVFCL